MATPQDQRPLGLYSSAHNNTFITPLDPRIMICWKLVLASLCPIAGSSDPIRFPLRHSHPLILPLLN